MKQCIRCKEIKPLSNFYERRDSKSKKVHSYCKECTSINRKENYKKNIEKNPNYVQEIRIRDYDRGWCKDTIIGHIKRGYVVLFDIDKLQDIIKYHPPCAICGAELEWFPYGKNKWLSPTLDRINNEKYMTLENTQILCSQCNTSKLNRTQQQFIDHMKFILPKLDREYKLIQQYINLFNI